VVLAAAAGGSLKTGWRVPAGLPGARAFLPEDSICAYLDRVRQVIVIRQDEHDGAGFACVAAMALYFVAVEPKHDDSIAPLEVAHSTQLHNVRILWIMRFR
jgi:hypothetical protein